MNIIMTNVILSQQPFSSLCTCDIIGETLTQDALTPYSARFASSVKSRSLDVKVVLNSEYALNLYGHLGVAAPP